MTTPLPQVTRTYQNFAMDSTRWQRHQPRPDDIVISTPPKSGTTWTQEIVRQLIFCGQPDAPERDSLALSQISPWLDQRRFPLDEVLNRLEAQQHRRFVKSHLRLDGLPYFPQVKYIACSRDAHIDGVGLARSCVMARVWSALITVTIGCAPRYLYRLGRLRNGRYRHSAQVARKLRLILCGDRESVTKPVN